MLILYNNQKKELKFMYILISIYKSSSRFNTNNYDHGGIKTKYRKKKNQQKLKNNLNKFKKHTHHAKHKKTITLNKTLNSIHND